MIITQISASKKNKKKIEIYIDDEYRFFLYYSDIKKLGLLEGQKISEEKVSKIINDIVIIRGKKRIYHLLSRKDYTYNQLVNKLVNGGYDITYIGNILNYFVENNLVNDRRYANNYIEIMKDKKSKKEIEYLLINKGVDKKIIKEILTENEQDELSVAINLIKSKYTVSNGIDYSLKRKIYSYLARKGFESKNIVSAINYINNI